MTRTPSRSDAAPRRGEDAHPSAAASRRWLAAALAASLLVVTPALAQVGARGAGPMAPGGAPVAAPMQARGGPTGPAFGPHGRHDRAGRLGSGPFGRAPSAPWAGRPAARHLAGLPLGTTVRVETFDVDPTGGAEPLATATLTIGEASEAAFEAEVRALVADAAYVRTTIGARTERIVLGPDAPIGAGRGSGALAALRLGRLDAGGTVSVAVFGDADDAEPTATLGFTPGVDSAAAFHAELAEAAADAAAIEVSLPEQVRTVPVGAVAHAPRFGTGSGPFGPR